MANLEYFLNIRQDNILSFKKFKYLKWSAGVLFGCIAAYVLDEPLIKPNGGTWLGYSLGVLGAVLILWLLVFGMRKRAYGSTLGTVRGWLSAHVYLGLTLGIVVTLHSGFEFGWNVHTLTYVLVMCVILSGLWGVFLYLRYPTLMGNLLNGQTLQQHGQTLKEIDNQSHRLAVDLPSEIQALVNSSASGKIFAGHWQRFTGKNLACETQKTVTTLEKIVLPRLYRRSSKTEKSPVLVDRRIFNIQPVVQEIYTLQFRRLQQLNRIREYVRLKSWTQIWLIFHVPLSIALLAALIAHVVSVFFFW